jgi:hypothetical protein
MSTLEVNKITPAGSETTVTLGDSGDSIDITSGATVTNFKSTGIDDNADATAITIDSSENVLVKKTAANDTDVGITLYNTGKASFTVAGDASIFNRTSDNGNVVLFRQAGTNCGSITSYNGNGIFISAPNTNGAALLFSNNAAPIYPAKKTDSGISISDDHVDLGASAHRFDDIHATNGTIQTSDQQEKNTITDSDLGLDFINRLSPKSYIFNGKTRTHYGLVAQDVETVLSEISKTSADFAGFIKTDISEKQDGSSYRYGLRYHEFIAPLIKAIKELKEENDSLKARVTTLEG